MAGNDTTAPGSNRQYRFVEYAYGTATGVVIDVPDGVDPARLAPSAKFIPKSGRWDLEARTLGPWTPVDEQPAPPATVEVPVEVLRALRDGITGDYRTWDGISGSAAEDPIRAILDLLGPQDETSAALA